MKAAEIARFVRIRAPERFAAICSAGAIAVSRGMRPELN